MRTINSILYIFLDVVSWTIFARAILSFFPLGYNKISNFLVSVTEPILAPIRVLLNRFSGGYAMRLDFSPFVALILIRLLQQFLVG